ncbi:MAG: hemolysin family protein [Bacteroidota bacterium]
MSTALIILIFFFVLSIAFSFLCSILEAVLLSITPSYVQRKVQEGGQVGELLQSYKKDIDRPLSAILTLNTIAHTVGAIGVGAQASTMFEGGLEIGSFSLNYESLIAAGMTLAILILSEIIPKTIGANKWRSLAPFTVKTLNILIVLLLPLVWLSQRITKTMKQEKGKSVLSRADFVAMTQAVSESGELAKNESTIIGNLLQLEKLVVRDIMTPRTVMSILDESDTLMEYYKDHPKMRFSRIPVYKDTPDNITGLILKDELLKQLVEDNDNMTLAQIKRPIAAVRDDLPVSKLFEELTQQRSHIVIVVDEYGSVAGLATMEDVIETLLGMEILDESDTVEDLQKLARERWEKRARNMGLIEEESKDDA